MRERVSIIQRVQAPGGIIGRTLTTGFGWNFEAYKSDQTVDFRRRMRRMTTIRGPTRTYFGAHGTVEPKFSSWSKTELWQVVDVEPMPVFGKIYNG